MNSSYSEIAQRSEEETRNTRLGYGLRAVAVSIVVAGLAIAVAESTLPGAPGTTATVPLMQAPARSTPLTSPATPAAAPAVREADDPMLNRSEEGVVQHG